ncbi:MAG: hypothetical protein IPK91_02550 [Saprospiraceae bacterium]|nr:hypothetical protein [Saprospiraceae bacterium]MBK8296169.1 hypothetical protein [Saprospiraceae bacterium]
MNKTQPNPEYFGLHIGELVKKLVEEKGYSHRYIATKMGISYTGSHHKYANPIYGSIYDLIKISQILNADIIGLIYNEIHVRYPELFAYKEFHNVKQYINGKENDPMAVLKKENESLYALIKVLKAAQKQ